MSKPITVAPTNWKDNPHWYLEVPEPCREAYALKFCSRTVEYTGQTCVVVSYPRQNGFVALYDLDGGIIRWMEFKSLRGLTKGRATDEMDFYRDAILRSLISDEASDIWFKLEV